MKKSDKLLIAIIVLSCLTVIFCLAEGIMCYDSSGSYVTRSYYSSYTNYVYGYGDFAISAMVMAFISLIFSILALALKKNQKRNLLSIGTIVFNLITLILIICAAFGDVYYGYYDDYVAVWALSLTLSILVFILAPVYLGISENENKAQARANAKATANEKSAPSADLAQCAEELKSLKTLLDDGILTEQEYVAQKEKLFSNMNVKVEVKTAVSGVYDFGSGITLTLNDTAFVARSSIGALIMTGKYELDNGTNTVCFIKNDGGKFKFTVDTDGSLVSEKGVRYPKVK